jgi:hypothetical protein
MGLSPFSSCSADQPSAGNPDPGNFKILRIVNYSAYTLTEILYPGCANFEGKKILLFRAPNQVVMDAKVIDPHFCDGPHLSPIARFRPDQEGWLLGCAMAIHLIEQDEEADS